MDIGHFGLDDLDFDLLRESASCPNCGVPSCICGVVPGITPQSSSIATDISTTIPTNLFWPDQDLSPQDKAQSFYQLPSISTSTNQSNFGNQQGGSITTQQQNSSSSTALPKDRDCSCLQDALLVSEQLDHYPTNKLAFNNILTLGRRVLETCERYSACSRCDESLISILCVTALRRISIFYKHMISAPGVFDSVEERTFRCHVGSFETDAVLDEDTCRAALLTEIRRALKVAARMGSFLEPGSPKRNPADETTLRYHRELMQTVSNDLQTTLDMCQ